MIKSHVVWTETELEILRQYGSSVLLHEMTSLLPRHTATGIKRKREQLGIKVSEEYLIRKLEHARSHIDLDNLCKTDQTLTWNDLDDNVPQILLGSILGDGGIKKSGKTTTRNFIFFEMHCRPQFDYTDWKARQLSIFHAQTSRSEEKNYCQLWTASHPIFTMLRHKFYGIRSKYFLPLDILSCIDHLGIMIWYLDDGYLGRPINSNRRICPHITASGFDIEGLKSFVRKLNEKLGLTLTVFEYKKKNRTATDKRVAIDGDSVKKLFPVWREIAVKLALPKCMYYKLGKESYEQT